MAKKDKKEKKAKKAKAEEQFIEVIGPGDPPFDHAPLSDALEETVADVAWSFLQLSETIANHNPALAPSPDAVLTAAERIVALASFSRPTDAPDEGSSEASASKGKKKGKRDSEDEAPRRSAGRQARNARERNAPRSTSAYCDCEDECWKNFDEDYDGCDCDPKQCRREWQGKDAGPCGCIKPKPLQGGRVEMVEDKSGNWRWEEQT